jgi:hypothetical protein
MGEKLFLNFSRDFFYVEVKVLLSYQIIVFRATMGKMWIIWSRETFFHGGTLFLRKPNLVNFKFEIGVEKYLHVSLKCKII